MGGLNEGHDYDDKEYHGNKRTRARSKGSVPERLDLLERILLTVDLDESKLSKKDKDKIKKIKKGESDHPEKDDD